MDPQISKWMEEIWSKPASTSTPQVILLALEKASKERGMTILQARDSKDAGEVATRAIEMMEEEIARLEETIKILRKHPMAIYHHTRA